MHPLARRVAVAVAAAVTSLASFAAEPNPPDPTGQPTGFLPAGPDTKPLNLDFETGDLTHWTATGDAFAKQPVEGDLVSKRRNDMKSQHQGKFWIGGFEVAGDKPTGTLTSVPFKVSHPWAAFLFAAGPNPETRVEIVRADNKEVIFKASGAESENLQRIVLDLNPHQGKEIFIRLVDEHTGHWGHLNFDDFRFYESKPNFPQAPKPPAVPPLDAVKNQGLTADAAAKAMTLPEGFNVTVFAAEPDVHQPVGFAIDPRGRLWVAEAHNYPTKSKDPNGGKDLIVIFEDSNNDGKFDKRTVFTQGLNLVSGIEVGFGGVWVGQAPNLLFIPDRNGDDKPDGPPEILLDGFGFQDTHETLNSFNWGPDGWLYGCHGVFTHSNVGKPGAPDTERQRINAGIWRYHPTKHIFEVFAEGASNQWGIDWDDRGQSFMTACVIPHLYHVVQGARYQRQAGKHFNPHHYKDIQHIGDHVHWAGEKGPHAGNNRSDAAGGGHAHCGALIYLGGAFPPEYRNTILMSNIHGNRLNNDKLVPKGSGFVGTHGKDFLLANDKWFRAINFKYGPDGSLFLIDWYDKQACHLTKAESFDRTNGRIYKIAYGQPKSPEFSDVSKLGANQLIALQSHNNDWYVRHARRILQQSHNNDQARNALTQRLTEPSDTPKHLRTLWALHAVGGATDEILLKQLKHADPHVRAWAIQLAAEDKQVSPELLSEFARLAREDPSPVVRLYLASALQRLPLEQRWDTITGLLNRAEDATDHNLPLMVWYAFEPLVASDPARALKLSATTKLPDIRTFTARRAAAK